MTPPLTWGLFKKQVESHSVKDTTVISWIDVSGWDGVLAVDFHIEDDKEIANIS